MTAQIVIRSSPLISRRKLLLSPLSKPTPSTSTPPLTLSPSTPPLQRRPNVGEVAGGTAAECAAICCCCPCVLMEFLILTVYKIPSSVCRRIWKKRLMMKKKKRGLLKRETSGSLTSYCDASSDVDLKEFETVKVSIDGSDEAVELDKQMWEQFHNTGFWRSPSQRYA